jgi:serine/threonine protein kinase/tetratricopeptide (TPR) repeat protein
MSEPADAPTGADVAQRLWSLWEQGQQPDVRTFVADAGSLSTTELVAVLRVDQHRRWGLTEPILAESYLQWFPSLQTDPERAVELIFCEYLLREEHGERPTAAEYVRRFPAHAERLRQQFAFHGQIGSFTGPLTRPDLEPTGAEGTEPTLPPPALPSHLRLPAIPGYDLVRELGRGGMGVVYEAIDRRTHRRVALKTMQGIDAVALLRFKQEFRTLAGLSHPNLVTLYEMVGDDPLWFFTMELVEGVNFLEHIRPSVLPPTVDERLPPAVPLTRSFTSTEAIAATAEAQPTAPPLSDGQLAHLRHTFGQLADAVHFLHRMGRLHRDLKPSNVLITPQGRVVVLDFGLATELDRTGRHRSVHLLGTVVYMAPEQAARRDLSPASDWYALGVMLYEALAGRLPFDGDVFFVLNQKQTVEAPPLPTSPNIPTDLAELCQAMLRRKPEGRPSGEEILARLAAGQSAAPVLPSARMAPAEAPLIGRQTHLQALEAAFSCVQGGRTTTVFVHGRSGAGKSALLRCFLDGLRERHAAVVLEGRCYEQESVPYKALDSLVDALGRYLGQLARAEVEVLLPRDIASLARVFPVLRQLPAPTGASRRAPEATDPQEVRRRGLGALRELLARLGDRQALVLAVDDLQWGDIDSAAVLADLLRPPDPPLLLLLASYRSEDAATSPCLRALLGVGQAAGLAGLERREVAVEPLTVEERRELALALLGGQDAAAASHVEAIAQQSGGYPFFVSELVQYVRLGGSMASAAGELSLSDVLLTRVQELPEEARRLLEVVAVAGRPLAEADAIAAADLEGSDQHALLTLRAARMLRGVGAADGNAIEIYHDRIRESIVLSLGPQGQQHHHLRLAEVLEASGRADPETLGVHWQGAGDRDRAGRYYARAAARASQALAFDRAANLYRRALELLPVGDSFIRGLQTGLGDALANAGRGAEAAQAYLECAATTNPQSRLELQRKAALQLLSCGHVDAGLDTLRQVLAAVGLQLPRSPARAIGGILWHRMMLRLRGLRLTPRDPSSIPPADLLLLEACLAAAVGLSMVDPVQGAYFHVRALRLALRVGSPRHLVHALAMEAGHESIAGTRSRRRTTWLLNAADEAALHMTDPYGKAVVALARGIAAALCGDWPDGARLCEEAEGILRESCTGAMWELGTAYRFGLWPRMFMGQAAELRRRLPLLLKEAQERDDLYTVTNLILVLRTFVHLVDDEPAQAREELAQVMDRWSRQGFHVQHMNRLHDEVQIDLYQGEAERALERLEDGWGAIVRTYLLRVQQVRIFLHHLWGRCALAATPAAEPRRHIDLIRRRCLRPLRKERTPWADALASLIDAGLTSVLGDAARAAAQFGTAAMQLDACHMGLYAAAARRRQGELLGGSQGQELIARADAWMSEQGARNIARLTAMLAPARVSGTA